MNDYIQNLLQRKKNLEQELKKLNTTIRAIQDICPHTNTIYLGHDSHYDHRECQECGYTLIKRKSNES